MLFLLRVFDSCDFLWIFFCRAFEYFAFTLVAILSESDGDSQSLEAWLLRFIEFMSIDCDSLTSLLLSTLFVSWSETWVEVRDVIPSWLRETEMWLLRINQLRELTSYKHIQTARDRWYNEMLSQGMKLRSGKVLKRGNIQAQLKF